MAVSVRRQPVQHSDGKPGFDGSSGEGALSAVIHCSKCRREMDGPGHYCRACKRAYMRVYMVGYRARLKRELADLRLAQIVRRNRKRLKNREKRVLFHAQQEMK